MDLGGGEGAENRRSGLNDGKDRVFDRLADKPAEKAGVDLLYWTEPVRAPA